VVGVAWVSDEAASTPAASASLTARLTSIRLEAEGVLTFALEALPGERLPAFGAGAHIDLQLPGGLVRQYSLTNASDGRRYEIAVALDAEGRGGSRWLHERARVGEVWRISAPRNSFPLAEQAASSVLLAGGVGVTPILAMARRLQALGRPWRVLYAARRRAAAPFLDALVALGGEVRLHFDDEAGALFDVAAAVSAAPLDAHLYCCGPAGMIAAFEAAVVGRPADRVHVERFGPAPAPSGAGGLVVELARSGLTLAVGPEQTILEAVLAAGVKAPSACRNGVCGTCETRVLEGVPDHRDLILSPAERAGGASLMICCSRALTPRLRLDL
jgi:vanillate O-demethylase ferredoxin subunit